MDNRAAFPTSLHYILSHPILLSIVIAAALLTILYRAALPKPLPGGIPYNAEATRRLFGDLPAMFKATGRRRWIWKQPQRHGAPLAQIMLMPFSKPTVVVSDYRETVDICARRLKEFDRGTRVMQMVGITAPNFHFGIESRDPRFRVHRELLRDLMTASFLDEISAPRVYDKVQLLVELWEVKRQKAQGRPFKAEHDFSLAALDIISSVSFGMEDSKASLRKELNHFQAMDTAAADPWTQRSAKPVDFPPVEPDPEVDALLDLADMMAIGQKAPFPYLAQRLALLLSPRHGKGFYYRRALIRRQTDKSLKKLSEGGVESRESALDQLLWREMNAAKRMGREPDFYSPVIRDEILGFILGGHDTSATMLAWWVKHMATYQSVQTRLRADLRSAHAQAVSEDRMPTMAEITQTPVPYLDAVIEETLRMNTVVTILVRRALCDTQILGYPIPKGTDVMMSTAGPSFTEPALEIPESRRSPGSREAKDRLAPAWDAEGIEAFRPSRWLKQEGEGEDAKEFFDAQAGPCLPFSTGPRGCFGKKLGWLQMRTQITLLLWNFQIEELDAELNGDAVKEKMVNLPRDCYVKLSKAS